MDGQQETRGEAKVIPDALMSVGKDEMNLVETPLSEICRRSKNGAKTLVITREQTDQHTGQLVTRTTTVTGADEFGLLKPCDDIVTIGLISRTMQFAQERGEMCRKVPFSGHSLCRDVGWDACGRNYRKLEASLDRLSGVRIKTKEGWFDNGEKEWKSLNFGIIDTYELCTKGRYHRRRPKGQLEFPMSYFVWSEVPFKSFCDNYVKSIDMHLFRAINRSAVALRLYRFTDKRFYYSNEFDIGLSKLAREHLALSPQYAPSQMKREIDRGYDRLIEQRYLADLNGKRYFQGKDGEERVRFLRRKAKRTTPAAVQVSLAHERSVPNSEQVLVDRGCNASKASEVTKDPTVSETQMELVAEWFDWEIERGTKISNRGAWLYSACKEGWKPPDDFKPKSEREAEARDKAERKKKQAEAKRREDERRAREAKTEENRLDEALAKFSAEELKRVEEQAVAAGPSLIRRLYREAKAPEMQETYRRQLLRAYLLKKPSRCKG